MDTNKIAIYGAGRFGCYIKGLMESLQTLYSIECFIDGYSSDREIDGIIVLNPKEFIDKLPADMVIVAMLDDASASEAVAELIGNNYNEVYLADRLIFESGLPLFDEYGRLSRNVYNWSGIRPTLSYMEYQVADECNLKCNACMHFSNLVNEPKHYDYNEYSCMLKILADKFFNIRTLRLMGGEPLLNEDLYMFLRTSREFFPLSDIRVATNGLLVKQIDKCLIETMKETGACFDITQYPPIRNKVNEIIDYLRENKVRFCLSEPVDEFQVRMSKGHKNPEDVFYNSCLSKTCTFLRNDKLFVCPHIPMLYESRDYFGFDISREEYEQSSIDFNRLDGWEILKLLRKPFSMCRFCSDSIKNIEWECGKASKEDWIVED